MMTLRFRIRSGGRNHCTARRPKWRYLSRTEISIVAAAIDQLLRRIVFGRWAIPTSLDDGRYQGLAGFRLYDRSGLKNQCNYTIRSTQFQESFIVNGTLRSSLP